MTTRTPANPSRERVRCCFFLILLSLFTVHPSRGEEARPNIVVFIADDLDWRDCSMNNGHSIPTPNMAKVAHDGMNFSHAFVASPSCAPSRAALLTGLNSVRNGAMFNHAEPRANIKKWPAYFQELGYEVVAIGKTAHYEQVKDYGFDYFSHFKYHDDVCIEAAVEWLGKRESTKPLCFLVGTNWPHVPWPVETRFGTESVNLPPTQINTPETQRARTLYAQAVANADRDLGLVYDAVRRKFGDNVFFLFSADHGAQWPFGKWNLYDSGIRTPMLAVWPNKIASDAQTSAMVSWLDILPTCLDVAGGKAPTDLDGTSFLPVLRGNRNEHRDAIFTTHSGDGKMNDFPIRSIRTRDWKYIRNLDPTREFHSHIDLAEPKLYWNSWAEKAKSDSEAKAIVDRYVHRPAEELYDLAADPYEQRNLASDPAQADRMKEMGSRLDGWMKAQGDLGAATKTTVGQPR